jgi:dolichol-phosphate mannosyltransferase
VNGPGSEPNSICVLVPALNEADNLAPTVEALRLALSETVEAFEIIIVDDGSTDGTGELADRLAANLAGVRALHNPIRRGIGYAYALGYEETVCNHFV